MWPVTRRTCPPPGWCSVGGEQATPGCQLTWETPETTSCRRHALAPPPPCPTSGSAWASPLLSLSYSGASPQYRWTLSMKRDTPRLIPPHKLILLNLSAKTVFLQTLLLFCSFCEQRAVCLNQMPGQREFTALKNCHLFQYYLHLNKCTRYFPSPCENCNASMQ